jgi:6-phosphogluconolactonase
VPDAAAAGRFAKLLAERIRAVVQERGAATVALSGGSGPWQSFRLLADEDVPWEAVELFQVDERVAPHGDDERNLTHLEESLPAAAWARMRPMPVEADDLDAAAAEYAALLPDALDIVHLGIGPDGHTASLFPGTQALTENTRLVVPNYVPKFDSWRITFTYRLINAAGAVAFLSQGPDKAERLRQVYDRQADLPAAGVHPSDGTLSFWIDRGAAAQLQTGDAAP